MWQLNQDYKEQHGGWMAGLPLAAPDLADFTSGLTNMGGAISTAGQVANTKTLSALSEIGGSIKELATYGFDYLGALWDSGSTGMASEKAQNAAKDRAFNANRPSLPRELPQALTACRSRGIPAFFTSSQKLSSSSNPYPTPIQPRSLRFWPEKPCYAFT